MTKAQQAAYAAREARLLPNGVPRWIRCYDNRDETIDRYTVVFTGRYTHLTGGEHNYLAMNSAPFHPQGFGQHGSTDFVTDCPNGAWPPALGRKCHLGWRIKFEDLPADCQKVALADYVFLWGLKRHPLYRED